MLAFQKENHLISESFGEEPHKNATFCLLSGSALLYLLKYSTFHLAFHQHLNPFSRVRGWCSTQTGKGHPPRLPAPNLCCFKETCLNSIHKCIMTGCPHSCILNTPHYSMDAQHRPQFQVTLKDIDEFHGNETDRNICTCSYRLSPDEKGEDTTQSQGLLLLVASCKNHSICL